MVPDSEKWWKYIFIWEREYERERLLGIALKIH
jgi:hypothetical protein